MQFQLRSARAMRKKYTLQIVMSPHGVGAWPGELSEPPNRNESRRSVAPFGSVCELSELPLRCATTAQNTVLRVMFITAPGLTRSCGKVITPQLHRHTGAVESFLNYPQIEYSAPTSSSSLDRTGTKMDFESRRHIAVASFPGPRPAFRRL